MITTIKINRREYEITDKDMFLDNGHVTQLISQKGPLRGWDYESLKLSKKAVQHILSFPQTEHETSNRFWEGCRLFSIKAKE